MGWSKKNDDLYSIAKENIEVSRDGFIEFITQKFLNYTPYLVLKRMNLATITKDDITNVLKGVFKQEFQEKTWETYSLNLINWFLLSKVDIKSRIIEPKKGRGAKSKLLLASNNAVPRISLKETVSLLDGLNELSFVIKSKYNRDLILLGIMNENRIQTDFAKELKRQNSEGKIALLKQKIMTIPL